MLVQKSILLITNPKTTDDVLKAWQPKPDYNRVTISPKEVRGTLGKGRRPYAIIIDQTSFEQSETPTLLKAIRSQYGLHEIPVILLDNTNVKQQRIRHALNGGVYQYLVVHDKAEMALTLDRVLGTLAAQDRSVVIYDSEVVRKLILDMANSHNTDPADLPDIYRLVLDAIINLAEVDDCELVIIDAGRAEHYHTHERFNLGVQDNRLDDDLHKDVFEKHKLVYLPNIVRGEGVTKHLRGESIRSLLAIPIPKLGAIFAYSAVNNHFTRAHIDYITTIVSLISLLDGVQKLLSFNTQLVTSNANFLRQLTKEIDVLNKGEHMVQAIARAMRRQFGEGDKAWAAIYPVVAGQLQSKPITSGLGTKHIRPGTLNVDPNNSPIFKRILASNTPVFANGATGFAKENKLSDWAGVRLNDANGSLLGVLFINRPESNPPFTPTERSIIGMFAHVAAVGLSLTEKQNQRDRELLYELRPSLQVIIGALNSGDVVKRLLEEALRLTGLDHGPRATLATLHKYDADTKTLNLTGKYPIDLPFLEQAQEAPEFNALRRDALWRDLPLTGTILRTDLSGQIGSVIVARIPHPQKHEVSPYGVLCVYHPAPEGLSNYDREIVNLLAGFAAAALDNAEKLSRLKRQTHLVQRYVGTIDWQHTAGNQLFDIHAQLDGLQSSIEKLPNPDPSLSQVVERIRADAKAIGRAVTGTYETQLTRVGLKLIDAHNLFVTCAKTKIGNNTIQLIGKVLFDSAWAEDKQVIVSIDRMERIFKILLDNALQATNMLPNRPAPSLAITTSNLTNALKLALTDTGGGIPNENRDSLFVDVAPNPNGSGYGLLVAQAMLEDFGGWIELTNTDSNGTTFTIFLPLAPE